MNYVNGLEQKPNNGFKKTGAASGAFQLTFQCIQRPGGDTAYGAIISPPARDQSSLDFIAPLLTLTLGAQLKLAIIGDIHGNLEALSMALKSIENQDVDKIVCMGDLIDGGDHPDECIDLVRRHCDLCVRGNHDEIYEDIITSENNIWLQALPETVNLGGWIFTHFSPRNRSDKIRESSQAWNAFDDAKFERCCVGHAHIRALFKYDPSIIGDCHELQFKNEFAQLQNGERYLYVNPSLAYNRAGFGLMYSIITDDSIQTFTVNAKPIPGYE